MLGETEVSLRDTQVLGIGDESKTHIFLSPFSSIFQA